MNMCYIGLGSNLENPLKQVTIAIKNIREIGLITAQSSWYKSTAIGPGEQPDYINGVICLITHLSSHKLLSALQDIEKRQGRTRDIRWSARTLDLDILLFNDAIISTNELIIPHPQMLKRNFVIHPLFEIAPELILPQQISICSIMASLPTQGLEKLSQNS